MKALLYSLICLLPLASIAEEKEWDFTKFKEKADQLKNKAIEKVVGTGGGNDLFYLPILLSDKTPKRYGYLYSDVDFKSEDGTNLHGWIIPTTKKKPLGVVVFSHGNTGSINSHFGFCSWLANAGYHIFMFDYRGFGKSKGKPSRKGMIEDVSAALDFAIAKKDWQTLPIVSMGHSLGAAKSIVAIATQPKQNRLKAVISWSSFYTYVSVAKHMVGEVAAKIVTNEHSVRDHVKDLKQPLLVVHGKQDSVIPVNHANLIFKAAQMPKQLILSETGGHNNTMDCEEKKMQKQVLAWLSAKLQLEKK